MIVSYNVELDAFRHPQMVRERTVAYGGSSVISSPEEAVNLLEYCFRASSQAEEKMFLIALDVRKYVLGVFIAAHGQATSCMVSPREVYLRALLAGASSIIIAHNHPSGIAEPSAEDGTFTARMVEAGKTIGITLDDSLIISSNSCYSFHESGRL